MLLKHFESKLRNIPSCSSFSNLLLDLRFVNNPICDLDSGFFFNQDKTNWVISHVGYASNWIFYILFKELYYLISKYSGTRWNIFSPEFNFLLIIPIWTLGHILELLNSCYRSFIVSSANLNGKFIRFLIWS